MRRSAYSDFLKTENSLRSTTDKKDGQLEHTRRYKSFSEFILKELFMIVFQSRDFDSDAIP